MKIPNYQNAVISEGKLAGYLLSASPAYGRHKAAFFNRFGFSVDAWEILAQALREHASEHEVLAIEDSPFGRRYIVERSVGGAGWEKATCTCDLVYRDERGRATSRDRLSFGENIVLQETDMAVLTVDLPEYGLKVGDVGTVMLVHGQNGYEVEFMTLDGETLAVTCSNCPGAADR